MATPEKVQTHSLPSLTQGRCCLTYASSIQLEPLGKGLWHTHCRDSTRGPTLLELYYFT